MRSSYEETVASLVEDAARRAPDDVALLAPSRQAISYGGLHQQVAATAGSLASLGIGRGDRVAVVLPNGPDLAAAFLATSAAAVCAPLNPAYREQEADFYLADLGARALVTTPALATPARAVAARRGIPVIEIAAPEGGPGRPLRPDRRGRRVFPAPRSTAAG